jgi:hypothetical protein
MHAVYTIAPVDYYRTAIVSILSIRQIGVLKQEGQWTNMNTYE